MDSKIANYKRLYQEQKIGIKRRKTCIFNTLFILSSEKSFCITQKNYDKS